MLCPHCRTKRKTNDYEKELLQKVIGRSVDEVYTAEGCEVCGNGYHGRIAIQEVLLINQEIRDAISNNIPKEKLRELVYQSDVTTLLQDGLQKVVEGYTTFEEILKLIELDNDESIIEGKLDLKEALEATSISHQSKSNGTVENNPNEVPENKIMKPQPIFNTAN